MTPERLNKLKAVAARRQPDLTVILENVHDPHNISAVLRSCDAVGIPKIFILYTDPALTPERIRLGKRASAGARRWVEVLLLHDLSSCFERVRSEYDRILATHMGESAKSLFELDLTQPTALLFGNEHAGVSAEALEKCDGNFLIPQTGFVQSLNISVACAITLYEAFRQRDQQEMYKEELTETANERLFERYVEIHNNRLKNKKPK